MRITKKHAHNGNYSELDLGPKGRAAFSTIIDTMKKFRTDERKRMLGYVETWIKHETTRRKSINSARSSKKVSSVASV